MSAFYAVRVGRNSGIYSTWKECEAEVKGFPGAKYKKFKSEEEANEFINGGNTGQNNTFNKPASQYPASAYIRPPPSGPASRGVKKSKTSDHVKPLYESKSNFTIPQSSLDSKSDNTAVLSYVNQLESSLKNLQSACKKLKNENKHLKRKEQFSTNHGSKRIKSNHAPEPADEDSAVVYTDGSCFANGRRGARAGIGVYWGENSDMNVSERLPGRQTNNRAEIHAAVRAVNQAKQLGKRSLTINTDSQFMIKSMTQWLPKWKRNGYKTTEGETVKNKDDFEELEEAIRGIDVNWVHVRGHSGIRGNEEADRLATQGSKMASVILIDD